MGSCSSRQKHKYQKYRTNNNTSQQQTLESQKQKGSFRKQKTEFKVAPSVFVSLKKGNILTYYNVLCILGEGSFGRVSQVVHKSTGSQRAMKQIAKDKILITQKENMIQEVSILKSLDHPHIVSIYELYEDEFSYYLITEYLKGGDLFEGIKQRERLNESVAANYMKQILNAVNYCHQKNIIHRDLKPENILFESKSENNLKIIDFGTAKQVSGNEARLKQKTGTPYYNAPEVINQNYNKKCDIWSCGVILYIMMCGKPPFNGTSTTKLYENIQIGKQGQVWDDVSGEAKDFILKLLVVNPDQRYSAEQALLDPWIINNQRQEKVNSKTLENLKNFHNKSQLNNAILQLISTQIMTSKEKQQLTQSFKAIDRNSDGKLSKEELMDCYMRVYQDEIKCQQIVNKMFNQADVDYSGAIDYTEFVVAYSELQNLMAQEKLQKAFKLFDKDGNGSISKAELQDIMGGLVVGEQDWSNLFGELDLNGDGEVTYEEFTGMLLKNQ